MYMQETNAVYIRLLYATEQDMHFISFCGEELRHHVAYGNRRYYSRRPH